MKKVFHYLIPIFLLIGSLLVFKYIYPNPRNWYDHYLHLSKSIIQKRVDVPTLPLFYHDKIEFKGKTYLPFPPGASFVLIPFLYINQNVTQQQISILISALNITLLYLLLIKFTNKLNATLLSIFFAFGTSFFWSAIVGTTWFFAHNVSVFFIFISLLFHFRKRDFLSGIFLALAALTRLPVIVAGIFFVLQLFKYPKRLLYFLLGGLTFLPIFFGYNYLRFGKPFEMGYKNVYEQYAQSAQQYSLKQVIAPNSKAFNYFDIRSIPLHLYTFLVMPPDLKFVSGNIHLRPSPFGMGILFTSPLILLVFFSPYKKGVELNAMISAVVCAIPSFLHYAQGWVQFGYRFILDFIVFLFIVLSFKFKPTKFNLLLLGVSILVNFWGITWAIKLGW